MATKKDNLGALAKLGISTSESKVEGILPLTGEENADQIADILKAAKAATKDSGSSSNQSSADESGMLFVWVKGRTYISDTQRVDAGFYKIPLLPERLAKSPVSVVETFTGVIPPRKLTEIAKFMGVTHPEDFSDDELLAKITLTDWKPF